MITININDLSAKVQQAIAAEVETGRIKLIGFEGGQPSAPASNSSILYYRYFISGGFKVSQLCSMASDGIETIHKSSREPI